MIKTTFSFLLVTLLSIASVFGQQDAQYTHYMHNMNVLNPAYAGSRGTLSIGLLGRTQWVGLNSPPKTFTGAIHAPVGERTGIGFSVINDRLGPLAENNIYLDVSYAIPTSEKGKLAFGVKGGLSMLNVDKNGWITPSEHYTVDPSLNKDIDKTSPNFGAGILYYADNYYVGLSVPNILKTEHFENNTGGVAKATDIMHLFLAAGYVFDLSENLKFKPSTMLKVAKNSPLSVDLSTNFLINQKFELGANYRWDDSVSAMFLVNALKDLRVGYAYDYTLSDLQDYTNGSHEVILLWDIILTKDNFKSPRFF